MHELDEIDAEFRRPDPHAGRRQGHGEGRQDLEPILNEKLEVVSGAGVATKPDPKRIKDGVARRIRLRDLRQAIADKTVRLGCGIGLQTGSQVKTSLERCSG